MILRMKETITFNRFIADAIDAWADNGISGTTGAKQEWQAALIYTIIT
jgi:hypothetical protein